MALRGKTQPKFEEQEDDIQDVQAEQVEQVEQAEPAEKQTAPERPAEKPVATQKSRAVAPSPKFKAAFTDLEEVLHIDHVKALGVGTLAKLVADRGGFEMTVADSKVELGNWMDIEIYSYNKRWLISAGGDASDEASKDLLRTSYDNETVEGEAMDVKDYVNWLKEQGYNKAGVRQYIDLWCFIVNSEKGGEVKIEDLEMVQLQLSPTSVKQFTGFQIKAGISASMSGKDISGAVRASIVRKEYNGNKYAEIHFSFPS